MVMALLAGTTLTGLPGTAPLGGATATVVFWKAGRNLDTGSLKAIRPSSTSIMTATLVTALLMDAMRKIVSVRIGRFASRSASPVASR